MTSQTESKGLLASFVFAACLLASLWFSYIMFQPYLLAMLMGLLLALVGRTGHYWLLRKTQSPTLSAILTSIALYLTLVIPTTLLLLKAISDGALVIEFQKGHLSTVLAETILRIEGWPLLQEVMGKDFKILDQILSIANRLMGEISTGAVSVFTNIFHLFLQSLLALLTCMFLLRDGRRLARWIRARIPIDHDTQETVIAAFKKTAVSTVWATLAAATAQATIIFLGFLILGVPGAVLGAGSTFILAWVPLIGATPVWVAACIYLWSQGSLFQAGAMAVFGVAAGLIDNVIRPIVLKGGSDMHPFVSLMAIFGGVGLFGILGVFLGPIAVGTVITLLELWPLFQKRLELAFNTETRNT